MAVRTRRLALGRQSTPATVALYAVPVDRTAIVKQVQLYNNSGTSSAVCTLQVILSGGGNPRVAHRWDLGPLQGTGSLPYWLVLHEGDTLWLAVASGDVHYFVSGTLLLGDPS